MVSGNDAANVLASSAGGQARTAELMNAKAASLGAADTLAVNPHGLDAPGPSARAAACPCAPADPCAPAAPWEHRGGRGALPGR